MAKQALGKGLGALIQNPPKTETKSERIELVKVSLIDLNPQQPRKDFEPNALDELKASIKANGILQPLLVRKRDARYELVAGERRLRACKELGLSEIPVFIKEITDQASLEMALVENLQRKDLNPIEEARGYMRLMRDYELTQDKISEKVGKSRATVANCLRLLGLAEELQEMIEKGLLTSGHAKGILGLESPSEQIKLAKEIISKGLSVREVEEKVQERKLPPLTRIRILRRDPMIREVEERLGKSLSTKVAIKQGAKKGKIELEYYSLDDLERLIQILAPEGKR